MKGQKCTRRLAQTPFRAVANDRAADLFRRGKAHAHFARRTTASAGLDHCGGSDGLKALGHKQKLPAHREVADSQSVCTGFDQAESRLRPFARRRART